MRSLVIPHFSTSSKQDNMDHPLKSPVSPNQSATGHSRSSSGASNLSSPNTSIFSARTHRRWPSGSSTATSPDSPGAIKSGLDDLVEEEVEKDEVDGLSRMKSQDLTNEPICICDTIFCEHRQTPASQAATLAQGKLEWGQSDDGDESNSTPSIKRSKSGQLGPRMHRRWPSIPTRWRDKWPTASVTSQNIQSEPPSRESSSSRRPSVTRSLSNVRTHRGSVASSSKHSRVASADIWKPLPAMPNEPPQPPTSLHTEDPIDRKGLSPTPLLPPAVPHSRSASQDRDETSQQTLSIATDKTITPSTIVPSSTPGTGLPTPPLSATPSITSISMARSNSNQSNAEPIASSEDDEYWAMRLGHANFDIDPKPYMPEVCTRESCTRLLEDWESARIEFMRVAARVSEHYGPSSQTYNLTGEKWTGIDNQWRTNLVRANAEARANGEEPVLQSLARTQPLSKIPSLVDPERPEKFPMVDAANIVGPMVQYSKIQRTPSKKPSFLSIFTDPYALFARSTSPRP